MAQNQEKDLGLGPQPPSNTALIDELRVLFDRSEHEVLVARADQLLKRKRLTDQATRNVIEAARSSSLIHLGRTADAESGLSLLHAQGTEAPGYSIFGGFLTYARHYMAWAHSDGSSDAAKAVGNIPGDDARRLEAQLLYRRGNYAESALVYEKLLSKLRAELAQRKQPATTSRWSIASVTGRGKTSDPPLTAAEIQSFTSSINELATNFSAALVLSGQASKVSEALKGLPSRYELEYNAACAKIHDREFSDSEVCLEKAEALVRAELEEDEDDVEEALAPIMVQKAYLRQLAGDVLSAKDLYTQIISHDKADAASLAVAANNFTVCIGQIAFGKEENKSALQRSVIEGQESSGSRPTLPKEQYDALAEGLKKMRATSGKNVSRKLALTQRQAMARNRMVLLVQMGRYDACRAELARLKTEFPSDSDVSLIEASLIARQGDLEAADRILKSTGHSESLNAARIQLAAANGSYDKAVALLKELFRGRPAALVTAAALLEKHRMLDEAIRILTDLSAAAVGLDVQHAKMELSLTLMRNARYIEAAQILREVCTADPGNPSALAQLVVATSYIDAKEADTVMGQLPSYLSTSDEIDGQSLESLPPPKRKTAAIKRLAAEEDTQDATEKQTVGKQHTKKKKRKKRLPKDYDPNGPPPDPERWLPKTLRSGYKKKKQRNDANRFKGSQGADAAAAEVAAVKNAERSATRAASMSADVRQPANRVRAQKKKRNKR